MIDELIQNAKEESKHFIEELKDISFQIEEEIKELGIPFVLQSINLQLNIPRQLRIAQSILKDLLEIKSNLISEKECIYKEALEMYREEINESSELSIESLPNWIHEIFSLKPEENENEKCENYSDNDNSRVDEDEKSFLSFTTLAISHLDAAIQKLDPFNLSLLGTLERIKEAHQILVERLEIFKVEIDTIWKELEIISSKIYPFDSSEVSRELEMESRIIMEKIKIHLTRNNNSHIAIDINTTLTNTRSYNIDPTDPCSILKRSTLKKVLIEWKRIEKERNESISGSILLIGRLWNLLETPEQERFQLSPLDLSLNNIKILSEERHRLVNFQQLKFKELYDSQLNELLKLTTALKWGKFRQNEIISNCQSYTVDGLQYISVLLASLQPKLEKSLELISAINSRTELITKMREFEKSASDPARLFRSSFQLLQEEKFRKSAFPSLLKLENHLKMQLNEYKLKFDEDFTLEIEDERRAESESVAYITEMEMEISNRFMSSGIFGFEQSKQRKERQSSIPAGGNNNNSNASVNIPRYSTTSTNRKATNDNNTNNSVLPQRRKLN